MITWRRISSRDKMSPPFWTGGVAGRKLLRSLHSSRSLLLGSMEGSVLKNVYGWIDILHFPTVMNVFQFTLPCSCL